MIKIVLVLFLISSLWSKEANVNVNGLRVRKGPSTEFKILDVTTKGRIYRVQDEVPGWYQIDHLQYQAWNGRYYAPVIELIDSTVDVATLRLISFDGKFLRAGEISKSRLEILSKKKERYLDEDCYRVGIYKRGWISSNKQFTQIYGEEEKVIADVPNEIKIPSEGRSKPKPKFKFVQVTESTNIYNGNNFKKPLSKTKPGKVFQVVGEQNGFFKIVTETSDLIDTIFMDMNEYYDLNRGESVDIFALNDKGIEKRITVNKKDVRFNKNMARFGPGISRVVPVEVKSAFWLPKSGTKNASLEEAFDGIGGDILTHPTYIFSEKVAGYLQASIKEMGAVSSHQWFISGSPDSLELVLSLKTTEVLDSKSDVNSILKERYVEGLLSSFSTELISLNPFQTITYKIHFLEKSEEKNKISPSMIKVPIAKNKLIELKYKNTTVKKILSEVLIEVSGV